MPNCHGGFPISRLPMSAERYSLLIRRIPADDTVLTLRTQRLQTSIAPDPCFGWRAERTIFRQFEIMIDSLTDPKRTIGPQ
jgi:hypothetical protein